MTKQNEMQCEAIESVALEHVVGGAGPFGQAGPVGLPSSPQNVFGTLSASGPFGQAGPRGLPATPQNVFNRLTPLASTAGTAPQYSVGNPSPLFAPGARF